MLHLITSQIMLHISELLEDKILNSSTRSKFVFLFLIDIGKLLSIKIVPIYSTTTTV